MKPKSFIINFELRTFSLSSLETTEIIPFTQTGAHHGTTQTRLTNRKHARYKHFNVLHRQHHCGLPVYISFDTEYTTTKVNLPARHL